MSRSRSSILSSSLTAGLCAALMSASPPALASHRHACGPSDTHVLGQRRIDQGRYAEAVTIFGCVIEAAPTELEGYRGRAEAELLLGRFSDAMRDYALVTARVLPAHPDTVEAVFASYDARLCHHPGDVPALTGGSFVHWWYFDYPAALPMLEALLQKRPHDVYGTLYRGSNRLFVGDPGGVADLDRAISFAPASADVRFIVADAFTYAQPDPQRALAEASLALSWGLDTPRIEGILASSSFAIGDVAGGALHVQRHIELVTTESVPTPPLPAGGALTIELAPGRTYDVPVDLVAGQAVSIRTSSPSGEIYDSIVVLEAPGGGAAIGNDDFTDYLAGFDWVADQTGTFTLRVTSFEGVSTGELVVTRD